MARPKRQPQEQEVFSPLSLDAWRNTDALVQWARSSVELKRITAMAHGLQHIASGKVAANSEIGMWQAGRMAGWHEAIEFLNALSQYPEKKTESPAADFSQQTELQAGLSGEEAAS